MKWFYIAGITFCLLVVIALLDAVTSNASAEGKTLCQVYQQNLRRSETIRNMEGTISAEGSLCVIRLKQRRMMREIASGKTKGTEYADIHRPDVTMGE